MEQMRNHHTLHGTRSIDQKSDQMTTALYHWTWKQKIILGFTWLKETNLDINWQTGKIKWRPMIGNEGCADLPVNMPEQGSEEWVKPHIGNETSTHFIEEIEDEEEWKNSSTNSFSDIEDFKIGRAHV